MFIGEIKIHSFIHISVAKEGTGASAPGFGCFSCQG